MRENEAVKFLKNVSGKVGIFFHDDADGVCSAALVLRFLRQRKIKPVLGTGDIDEDAFKLFAQEPVDAAIFLDYALSQYPEFLGPWKGKPVLIVDHHPVINDLNKLGFLFINPRLDNKNVYISASQIVQKICKKAGLKGGEWIAHIGAVGDKAMKGSRDEETAAAMMDAVKAIEHEAGLVNLAGVIAGMEKMENLIYNTKYQKIYEKYKVELERQVEKFKAVEQSSIVWYEVKSNYSITSSLATHLFDIYPDKTLLIYSCDNHWCKVAGRSNRFDIGNLFRIAVAGIGKGGGHPVAAGAKIPANKLETFRKNLTKLMK
ncbi:MAG: hypothetical protein KQA33_02755 [Candidatus Aenigmarchaeota archaeon]|nr:hypothetical protein [Candidatus Aenigmarchaeota archaeon]